MNLKNLKNCSEILWCCLASLVVFWGVLLLVKFSFNLVAAKAPATIEVDGYVYERQTEPVQTLEKFGCTYVLKEGETE